jgi:hypothetical protein
VPDRVKRQVTSLLHLPPTFLPLSGPQTPDLAASDAKVEQGLARLEYPGLAYRKRPGERLNPGELLLMALSLDDLDPRLTEALPWLLVRFEGLDLEELVDRAKKKDLQNRLGFTVSLARQVAEREPAFQHRCKDLQRLEEALERSRLAREDTYGRRETSERMRVWLRENRPRAAEHWNLLTDLRPEHLPYVNKDFRTLADLPE